MCNFTISQLAIAYAESDGKRVLCVSVCGLCIDTIIEANSRIEIPLEKPKQPKQWQIFKRIETINLIVLGKPYFCIDIGNYDQIRKSLTVLPILYMTHQT